MLAPVRAAADDSTNFIQSEGNVPEASHAWQPTNEPDVLNPLGGNTQDGQLTSGSDKPAILNPGDSNFTPKTTLNYGADGYDAKTSPAYAISKYATQAKDATGQIIPGHYDVTLTAQGNKKITNVTKPLDIVFVVDLSGSMETTKDQAPETPRVPRFIYTEDGLDYVRTDIKAPGYFIQDRIDTPGYAGQMFQQYRRQDYVNNRRLPNLTDFRFRKVQSGQPDEWYKFKDVGKYFTKYEFTKIDNPGNLNQVDDSGTRADYLREGVSATLNWMKQQRDLAGQLSVGMVGFSGPTSTTNNVGVKIGPVDDAKVSEINNALDTDFCGSTWTQNGLERGRDMLETMPPGDTKLLILLTDGDPSYYGEGPVPQGAGFADSAKTDPNIWAETIKAAESIQKTTHIQGIGIETVNEAEFKLFTSPITPNSLEHDYKSVNDAADISKKLQSDVKFDVTQYVSRPTIRDGTISDPLGPHYDYVGDKDTVSVTGTGVTHEQLAAIKDNLTLDSTSTPRQLTVKDLTLGKDQKVTITYQVALNTEAADFVPGTWYPMNGSTTLAPTSNPNDPLFNFGIPAGRGPGTYINVSKIWQDTGTDRPQSVAFKIMRKTDTDSNWSTTGTIGYLTSSSTTDHSNVWEGNLTTTADGKTPLLLPRYSKDGKPFTYQIREDPVPGYLPQMQTTPPSDQADTQRFALTNQQYVLNVKKFAAGDDLADKPLTGAAFTLTNTQSKTSQTIDGSKSQPLDPGTYTIQETTAPSGYDLDQTASTFTLTPEGKFEGPDGQELPALPTSGEAQDGLYLSTNGGAKQVTFVKTDKPTVPPTTLRIKKINADTRAPLDGAAFSANGRSLNNPNNGPEFVSDPLTLGQQYDVQETKAPSGFVGLSQSIFVTAGKDGTVKVRLADGTEQSLTPGAKTPTRLTSLVSAQVTTTDANGNASREIVLTVGNHQKGFLPHTGNDDLLRLMLISFSFAGLAIALLALAFWQRRKEGDDE